MKLYAEISKTEAQDDGTIKVYGYASSEAVDSDGETITADAMKAALPDYMKFGAVREMHQAMAAGTAIVAKVEDDGRTYFGAHIVDPIAVKKVETGVYKGFSIGGKATSRDTLNKNTITGLKLVEVSLVDRPANPEAVFTCYKVDGADEVNAVDALADLLNKGTISASRLVELAKAETAPVEQPAAEVVTEPTEVVVVQGAVGIVKTDAPEPAAEPVEKGLYGVARFASLLAEVNYLQQDTAWEAEYEGDDSTLPEKIKNWLGTGLKLLSAMVKEEAAEVLADKADTPGDITKAADDLTKVTAELDLVKAEVAKVSTERDELQKRVTELESKPAPGKALLKAISKGEDVATEVKKTEEPAPAANQTPEQIALEQIKKIHQTGGIRTRR